MLNLGSEPVAIVGTIVAALTAVQQLALNEPAGVHTAIAVVLVVLGAILSRAAVSPTAPTDTGV
jgi:hypothetical protein